MAQDHLSRRTEYNSRGLGLVARQVPEAKDTEDLGSAGIGEEWEPDLKFCGHDGIHGRLIDGEKSDSNAGTPEVVVLSCQADQLAVAVPSPCVSVGE